MNLLRHIVVMALMCFAAVAAFAPNLDARETETGFKIYKDVVLDTRTGLMWARNVNIVKTMPDEDVEWMNSLDFGGYNDWRLPTKEELKALLKRGGNRPTEWLNSIGFNSVQPGFYHSNYYDNGTTYSGSVFMGSVRNRDDFNPVASYVWPVRGKISSVTHDIEATKGEDPDDLNTSFVYFCYRFGEIEWQNFYSVIQELEAKNLPVEEYLTKSACTTEQYMNRFKAPPLHCIAEDTVKREKFLKILWEYYVKKRKAPEKFAEVVNAKNDKGETLLDYIETYFKGGTRYQGELTEAADRIIAFACAHGAVYATHPGKKCP